MGRKPKDFDEFLHDLDEEGFTDDTFELLDDDDLQKIQFPVHTPKPVTKRQGQK